MSVSVCVSVCLTCGSMACDGRRSFVSNAHSLPGAPQDCATNFEADRGCCIRNSKFESIKSEGLIHHFASITLSTLLSAVSTSNRPQTANCATCPKLTIGSCDLVAPADTSCQSIQMRFCMLASGFGLAFGTVECMAPKCCIHNPSIKSEP